MGGGVVCMSLRSFAATASCRSAVGAAWAGGRRAAAVHFGREISPLPPPAARTKPGLSPDSFGSPGPRRPPQKGGVCLQRLKNQLTEWSVSALTGGGWSLPFAVCGTVAERRTCLYGCSSTSAGGSKASRPSVPRCTSFRVVLRGCECRVRVSGPRCVAGVFTLCFLPSGQQFPPGGVPDYSQPLKTQHSAF